MSAATTPGLLALCAALRLERAEERATYVAALPLEAALALEGALLAVVLVDSSLQVRQAAEEQLRRRPGERQAERPLPRAPVGEKERTEMVALLAGDTAFLAVLATTPRGADLLLKLSLQEHAFDDRLIELTLVADAPLIRAILALPLDVSGRALTLLDRLAALAPPARDVVLDGLVGAALQEGGVTSDDERARARAAIGLWVEGLLAAPEAAPSFADFLAGGARAESALVARVAGPPSPATAAALEEVARLLLLVAGPPARATLLARGDVAHDLEAGLAERRVAAWRLLLRDGLADPGELLAAARAEPAPGAAVELLRALPAELPPELAAPLGELLGHARASVRAAAAQALAKSPLLAALAAHAVDPGAPDASLELLAAQPPALAGPALAAYLEVERTPDRLCAALQRLDRPPPPTWARWAALLGHAQPRVRAAAGEAFLRLAPAEGEAVAPHLQALGTPELLLRAVERFALPGRHADAARVLLEPSSGEAALRAAVRVVAAYGDAAAWLLLLAFVAGDDRPRRRRLGTRAARAEALERLLTLPLPATRPGWARAAWPAGQDAPSWLGELDDRPARAWLERALLRLLHDRDPAQVALGLRLVEREGKNGDTLWRVHDVAREALERAARPGAGRRLRVGLARALRAWFPRAWVGPGSTVRVGKGGQGVLAQALSTVGRLGVGGLWADDVLPLLEQAPPDVARAAARLCLLLPGAPPLPRLALHRRAEVAEEAVRVGHAEQVEALLAGQLVRARRGETPEVAPERLERWLELRPRRALLPALEGLLLAPAPWPGVARRGLVALAGAGERPAVLEALARALERAAAGRDEAALLEGVALLDALAAGELAARLVPALAWAREGARQRAVDALRRAAEAGAAPAPAALADLLDHPLADVRQLALSLLRKAASGGLWELVRPHGPGGPPVPTDFAKSFLGVCEDAYEDSMGLALEELLRHGSGEVARRALKLLNQRQRELASAALLGRLDDAELETPVLTAFATWATRYLDPERRLAPELLEEERRRLRALLSALSKGAPGQVLPLLDEGLAHAIPYVRAAALLALGRLGVVERAAAVQGGLGDPDPLVVRAAAEAAAGVGPAPELDEALRGLVRAREPEVRAAARCALAARLPAGGVELVGLLADASPEVRLLVLEALRRRGDALPARSLEARLGDPDPRVRWAVLRSLGERSSPPGAQRPEVLRAALADPSPRVRLAALEVVAAWGALASLRAEVGQLAGDPSSQVASRALDLLGAPRAGRQDDAVEEPPAPAADEAAQPAGTATTPAALPGPAAPSDEAGTATAGDGAAAPAAGTEAAPPATGDAPRE